ncbi:hybrid sensor histidine kinase/response regulator [Thalassovita mangrovi]|uniref:histidine kinase n=1 Tax=Thalassovita mangrovi TaxID=2692236 RepID=A0A6L8LEL3_9RHOB|nr:ATP-binding protein [Thalassovita mangrovi]MYM54368.1 response regulator [Thalassovita mangrovi]
MTQSVFTSDRLTGGGTRRRGLWLVLVALALLCLLGAWRLGPSVPGLALVAVGATILSVFVLTGLWQVIRARQRSGLLARMAGFLEHDVAASLVVDDVGRVAYLNRTARARFHPHAPVMVADILQDVFANPSSVVARLQARAREADNASEDIVTRKGHVRLSVHRLDPEGFLWRIEEIGLGPARAHSGSGLPMLTVGRGNTILFMNDAARDFAGERARSLVNVFPELPLKNGGFNLALSVDGPRNCLVHEAEHSAGRREVYFLPMTQEEQVVEAANAAFDALPVAVLRLGRDGQILRSNRLARRLLSIGEEATATLPQLVEGLGRPIADWLAEAAEGRGVKTSEFLRVKEAEGEVFVQISLNRVEEADGYALIAVLHDATEMMNLEEQFVQSQKMQAIGELAGGIAHDFNNLLTAISGYCDLLLLRHEDSDPDYADLVQISQNANRAAALVGQLLAFSRKQTRRPEAIDIRDALADLAHLLNRLVGEKIELAVEHDPDPWNIRVDKRQLEQVLMNLVVNARDAMPEGGEIRIETSNRSLTEPKLCGRVEVPAADYLKVTVTDHGCGIPPERLQKVFDPFFTTKRAGEGTGLGLSTVYGIVKQNGGYVFATSEVGEGSTFTLLFPVCHAAPAEAPAPEAAARLPVPAGDGVILLVEDEAPVRAFAARALRLRGFTVIEAGSAEEALELLQDAELPVHLFVTDVIMPGLNGPTWVREALKTRPEARVVFVSGYAEDALDDHKGAIAGSVYLPKPFSLNELIDTVQMQLQ